MLSRRRCSTTPTTSPAKHIGSIVAVRENGDAHQEEVLRVDHFYQLLLEDERRVSADIREEDMLSLANSIKDHIREPPSLDNLDRLGAILRLEEFSSLFHRASFAQARAKSLFMAMDQVLPLGVSFPQTGHQYNPDDGSDS